MIELLKTPVITGVLTVIIGWISIWVKNRLSRAKKRETELDQKKREVFQNMIDLHSEKIFGEYHNTDWLERFAIMRKEIVVWASDEVLLEYALFHQKLFTESLKNLEEYEIHFAKAILEFRKQIGYKNKNSKIKAEQITAIFKAGWERPL